MSGAGITALGLTAGITIFIGLPIGRLRNAPPTLRALLNSAAVGVLVFLLVDVLSHAQTPVSDALVAAQRGRTGTWGGFAELAGLLLGGIAAALLSMAYYERWMGRRAGRPRGTTVGPGAMSTAERPQRLGLTASPARRVALLIAVGIGLHNFSEGLAIGQSAASGEVSLAVLLVVGFALHNATEGFGITAPLASEQALPSWGQLGVLGLIGGGPTFVGTLLGQVSASRALYVVFLALAAGSILYVVVQLVAVATKSGHRHLLYWGLLIGLLAGFITDFVVTASGA